MAPFKVVSLPPSLPKKIIWWNYYAFKCQIRGVSLMTIKLSILSWLENH